MLLYYKEIKDSWDLWCDGHINIHFNEKMHHSVCVHDQIIIVTKKVNNQDNMLYKCKNYTKWSLTNLNRALLHLYTETML